MFSTDSIVITPDINALIARIDEFKGAWRTLGTLAPEQLSALRKVATVESVGSSTRIEGSKLTDREVEALLGRIKIKSFTSRDEQEVAGYGEVMETVFSAWESLSVTENHLRQLHRDVLVYSDKDARHRGQYKTHSNNVVAFDETGKAIGVVFETATPFETPLRMQELLGWYRHAEKDSALHPLLVVAVFVVVFLAIHPFQDGNGRLSRILTTLLLLKAGYAYVPYSSLESIIEQNKQGYYLALRKTQTTLMSETPNWQPWVLFFLRALGSQVTRLEEKVSREKLLLSQLPKLSADILEAVRQQGRLTLAQAVTLTLANRSTVKVHFQNLVRTGRLARHGAGRGVWYTLP